MQRNNAVPLTTLLQSRLLTIALLLPMLTGGARPVQGQDKALIEPLVRKEKSLFSVLCKTK